MKLNTDREREIASKAALISSTAMTAGYIVISSLGIHGYGRGKDVGEKEGLKQPAPIERVVSTDAQTFDELDIEKGSIVYNDTTDSYIVYVDDTEVSPAQNPGWYEIDINNLVIPEQREPVEG